MNNILDCLEENSKLLIAAMEELLPEPEKARKGQATLFEAMRYSSLSGGKRLRPFLVISTASLFGVGKQSSLNVAAAIEFIHTYSLIHDDLPAMDDDDLRRGQPSLHKKFDEATAILAGDALQAYAFELLSDPTTHADPAVRSELVNIVAKASGPKGMVGGQMMDLLSGEIEFNMDEVTHLQRMKTGALFCVACEAGAILGKAPIQLRNSLRAYAQAIGLAFQITDDILDAASELDGDKDTARKNKSAGKATFITALGIEKAENQARMLSEQAIFHLEAFDKRADPLRDLARYIVDRKF